MLNQELHRTDLTIPQANTAGQVACQSHIEASKDVADLCMAAKQGGGRRKDARSGAISVFPLSAQDASFVVFCILTLNVARADLLIQ